MPQRNIASRLEEVGKGWVPVADMPVHDSNTSVDRKPLPLWLIAGIGGVCSARCWKVPDWDGGTARDLEVPGFVSPEWTLVPLHISKDIHVEISQGVYVSWIEILAATI